MAIEYVAQNITFRRLILYCAQDFISKPCCIQKLVGLGSHAHTLCVDMTNLYVKLGHVFTSTMAARGIRQDMEGQQRKDYIVGFFHIQGSGGVVVPQLTCADTQKLLHNIHEVVKLDNEI